MNYCKGRKINVASDWISARLAMCCFDYTQGGQKSDIFGSEFRPLLDALCLQFFFTDAPFLLNDVIITYFFVCRCKHVLFLCK